MKGHFGDTHFAKQLTKAVFCKIFTIAQPAEESLIDQPYSTLKPLLQ
jgi:hypothetical protein